MKNKYWENYYKSHRKPIFETSFAKDMVKYFVKGKSLIDLGCGNGRDSIYFFKKGLNVLGVDQCGEEINYLNKEYSSKGLFFMIGDFTELPRGEFDYIYSRFSLHSITKKGEDKVFSWVKKSLKKNGLFLFEVRSIKDKLYKKGVSDHYRRFLNFGELKSKLRNLEFKIIDSIEARGLAVYKNENPKIIRIVAEKRTDKY